ncbi:MAG TPA: M28 family metallopeptidase [Opitutaceae bacterium]|nr:M28 family metallopeptidase [Opitutaceae bacterium]
MPHRLRHFVFILFLGLGLQAGPIPALDPAVAARRVQAHATFLADDLMEGRGTGTRGYQLAAGYVAAQFARIGLEPGADHGSFLQPLRLLESTTDHEAGRLIVHHADSEDALTPINDMLAAPAPGDTVTQITAPAVFVGYGVQAPELGYDDLGGIDLTGKIAVILSGAPARFPSTQRAHYSSGRTKNDLLVARGAVGVVSILTPRDESRSPWAIVIASSRFPGMRLVATDGTVVGSHPQLRGRASVRHTAAHRLLVASGRTAEEIFATAERGEPQAFDLGVTLTVGGSAQLHPLACTNVLGWLPGTDPALAGEPIVVTGHLDHLGIGTAIDGDSIYNGAIDNAVGIGIILAMAEELAAGPRPARPVLFAALTAEEKGLLGAEHLANNPPARVQRFAANVNIDMPIFPAPVRDIVAWGEDHTTLGPMVHAAAARTGFTVSPDFMPEQTIFVRSDQYAFVRTGVPAIFIGTGQRSLDPGFDLAAAWNGFLRERYHKPNDDLSQPIDWPSTGAYTVFAHDFVRAIADDPVPPAWLPDDFFGGLYGRQQ